MQHAFTPTPPMPKPHRLLAPLVAAGLAVTACAAPSYDATLSPAENQLRASRAHFAETVGTGAAVGAVLGAGLGALVGHDARSAAAGGLIGAALGTGAGYAVARNNAERANTEAAYDDAIQQAEADAAAYRQSADAARQIAQAALADAERLQAQYRARQITAAQYRAGLAHYAQDDVVIRQQIDDAGKAAITLRADAARGFGGNGPRLASTADSIGASESDLARSSEEIRRALASVPQAGV